MWFDSLREPEHKQSKAYEETCGKFDFGRGDDETGLRFDKNTALVGDCDYDSVRTALELVVPEFADSKTFGVFRVRRQAVAVLRVLCIGTGEVVTIVLPCPPVQVQFPPSTLKPFPKRAFKPRKGWLRVCCVSKIHRSVRWEQRLEFGVSHETGNLCSQTGFSYPPSDSCADRT